MFNYFGLFGAKTLPSQSGSKGNPKLNLKDLINSRQEKARVDETIQGPYRKGRVQFQGSWWPALCDREVVIFPEETVRVVGIKGITLLVEPLGDF
ncbi:NfeD family protein [Kamptonema formosum]|uniref:NfeD family protein n=1 Tax=Kamptonema formosum TaxID=331992 RepID=UPI0003487CF4|nr:NfeD family protein [Oscillatoria sp. PCC 10802]